MTEHDDTCGIEGCDKPRKGRWCVMHYKRIKRHGSPDVTLKRGPQPGSNWVEKPSYLTVHKRLHKIRGRAETHLCSCGQPAAQWSYIGPREPGERMPYSENLDEYEPLCVSCHKRRDMEAIKKEFVP